MTQGVGNIFVPIPGNKKSHVRGWAQHWAELIDDEVGVIDTTLKSFPSLSHLYFDHGVNNKPGSLNLFGGVTDHIVQYMGDCVFQPNIHVVALDAPIMAEEYCDQLRGRLSRGAPSTSAMLNETLINMVETCLKRNKNHHLVQEKFVRRYRRVVIGDSHSTAYAAAKTPVIRMNGLTLYGAITKGIFYDKVKELFEMDQPNPEVVTLCAGSIDMRHHVGRRDSPEDAVVDLAEMYIREAQRISSEFLVNVELCIPVPVEWESRRIPKTGHYDGKPFWGSAKDRREWTEGFKAILIDEWKGDLAMPPQSWYEMDGEEFAKTHMEYMSSVHLNPDSYRRYGGWSNLKWNLREI